MFFLLFYYENSLDRYLVRHWSALWHWLVGHEVKVSMTYFSWSSDFVSYLGSSLSSGFALYLEAYLTFKHHTYWLWVSMTGVWPQNKCRSQLPIFHGLVIFLYNLKSILCINTILMDQESVWPKVWPQNKCKSQWSMFPSPVILLYILKNDIWCWKILSICESVWPKIWHKNKVGHSYLYFTVQWYLPYILENFSCVNIILSDY